MILSQICTLFLKKCTSSRKIFVFGTAFWFTLMLRSIRCPGERERERDCWQKLNPSYLVSGMYIKLPFLRGNRGEIKRDIEVDLIPWEIYLMIDIWYLTRTSFFGKHACNILRHWSNPACELSQFFMGQTAQSLTCSIMEKPHNGMANDPFVDFPVWWALLALAMHATAPTLHVPSGYRVGWMSENAAGMLQKKDV